MSKPATKAALTQLNLPTPASDVVTCDDPNPAIGYPVVVKPPCEGSSIDLLICESDEALTAARAELHSRHPELLVEQFVAGREMTVAVLDVLSDERKPTALPAIHIIPATKFYDYAAKYERNDTQYAFDHGLGEVIEQQLATLATAVHAGLGCRHLCRVDVILDHQDQPWVLEVNTMPGFTSHSLLPKAAARAGHPLPVLVDRLVRAAAAEHAAERPAASGRAGVA